MRDANQNVTNRLKRQLCMAAALGLGAVAYRALLDYDPSAVGRGLSGGDAAFFSPSANHPLFVYAIAAWILFDRRERFFGAMGSSSSIVPGSVLLGGAALVCSWSYYVQAPDLLAVSLALCGLGLSWWLGGGEAMRAAALPALVLLALIPMPSVLVNALVYELQLATSAISVGILNAIGLEAVQAADQFAVSGRVFQVIESCSGIRSIQTLLLTAILFQEIFYRSRKQSMLLVALAPMLGFAINEIRVLTLVFNPYSELASVHTAQGLLMLVVGILLLTGMDVLLARWIPAEPRTAASRRCTIALPRLVLSTAAIGLLAAASLIGPSHNISRELDWNPHDIPLRISGWRSTPLKLDRQYLGSTTFSKDANRRFHRGNEFIDVFAGVSERGRRSSSPISPKTLLLGTGRTSTAEEPFSLGPRTPEVTATTILSQEGRHRVIRWHANISTLARESFRALLALDRGPSRRPGLPQVIRLSTPITGRQGIEAADSRLQTFGRDLLAEIAVLEARARENQRRRTQGPDHLKMRRPL